MFIRPTLRAHHTIRGVFNVTEPTSGKLADIISTMRTQDPKMWECKFTPISNIDEYLRLLKMHGTPKEELELIEAKHKSVAPQPPRDIPPRFPYVHKVNKEQVYINTRIKGSKVKVSIINA